MKAQVTREILRVRRWFIARQIELTEARIRYYERKQVEQIEATGTTGGHTRRKLRHHESVLGEQIIERLAIDELLADFDGLEASSVPVAA